MQQKEWQGWSPSGYGYHSNPPKHLWLRHTYPHTVVCRPKSVDSLANRDASHAEWSLCTDMPAGSMTPAILLKKHRMPSACTLYDKDYSSRTYLSHPVPPGECLPKFPVLPYTFLYQSSPLPHAYGQSRDAMLRTYAGLLPRNDLLPTRQSPCGRRCICRTTPGRFPVIPHRNG